MSTTVTYKGSTLTTVDNQTRTLKTAGKYMEGDVVLTDVSSSGGSVTQDQNGFIVLPATGSGGGNKIRYVYSDINGEAPVDVEGYKYCSVDYAPLKDNKFRFWIDVDSSDLTFTAPVSVPTYSSYRYTGLIDWGDGTTQTEFAYDNTNHTHTYAEAGRYCVSIWRTGGSDRLTIRTPSTSADKSKVVAIEYYLKEYPTNTLTGEFPNLRKVRYSSPQTTVSWYRCSSLTDIVLPSSTTEIGNFTGLTSLQKLEVPALVTSIASSAFSGNTNMKEYHFKSTTPPTLGNNAVFNGIPNDCVIYVPAASLSAYQTANNWSTYASYMVGE